MWCDSFLKQDAKPINCKKKYWKIGLYIKKYFSFVIWNVTEMNKNILGENICKTFENIWWNIFSKYNKNSYSSPPQKKPKSELKWVKDLNRHLAKEEIRMANT